ncbi:MAG: RagB/SusD family nutrient uptake outer membrane protein [Rikenellaceae bacterium]|nr:RagB/SusD family nutrient uptake outer membrane protein [Rikenellaceae bacterium]
MNNYKNIIAGFLVTGIFALSFSSCTNDFLEENRSTHYTTQYLDTPEGLREMALGLPTAFKLHSAHEYSFPMTNYGVDEFTTGSDPANQPWNDYDDRLQSTVVSSSNPCHPRYLWDMAYIFVSTANIILEKAPVVLEGESDMNQILAEAHFVRGWLYFWMVQQWGDIPLITEPVKGLEREYVRAPKKEVVEQIVEDLKFAYDNLTNPSSITPGKIYKDAAAHYLAKVLLYKHCEINGDMFAGSKDTDLAEALRLCDEVIARRQLAPDFMDLWDYWGPDGANEFLDEVILAAQYTVENAGANGRYSNMLCLQFVSVYQNWTGMIRNLEGGREYARLRTTNYAMDVYDRVNDSRFWKSFRTTMTVNDPDHKNSFTEDLELGQTGIMWIINNPDDANRFRLPRDTEVTVPGSTAALSPAVMLMNDGTGNYDNIRSSVLLPNGPGANNIVPNVLPRYRTIEGQPNADTYYYPTTQNNSVWPALSKYLDGARSDHSKEGSQRDVIKARLGETYLIAAEIKVRQGKYQEAIDMYVNPLRRRAAYKSGEDRSEQKHGGQAYTESVNATEWVTRPTSFCPVNTYYLSNNIPVTTAATDLTIGSYTNLPAEDEAIIAALGYSSDYDRMLCFILNERSRELMGELIRWEDLARTKTLIDRAMTFNGDTKQANQLKEYHYLRPIPQEFLDAVWVDGRPLTLAEKQAMQNPGYR